MLSGVYIVDCVIGQMGGLDGQGQYHFRVLDDTAYPIACVAGLAMVRVMYKYTENWGD